MVNRANVASQFFITLGVDLDYLDETHVVIGQVEEGMEVLEKMNEVLTDEENRPYQVSLLDIAAPFNLFPVSDSMI